MPDMLVEMNVDQKAGAQRMTATLEFSLPAEESRFRTAIDAERWRRVVVEFVEVLRRRAKDTSGAESEMADDLKCSLLELVFSEGLSMDEVQS